VGHPIVRAPPPEKSHREKAVYVHSKLLIVDDRFISIGSTNLAARAFRVDSEVNLTWEAVHPTERPQVAAFADDVLQHWGLSAGATIESQNSHAILKAVTPSHELKSWILTHPFLSAFPWKFFFDPEETWAKSFKSWLKARRSGIR
jgi:phosphatidylserine/phosphatidylglycerophosphate/cardiolipin synthase-like enzyme